MLITEEQMKRIVSLEELFAARKARRSIVVPGTRGFKKPTPAAFMMNLSGEFLLKYFQSGMYLYEPKRESRYPFKISKGMERR